MSGFSAPGMKLGGCTTRGRNHHTGIMKRYAPFVLLATVLLVVLTPLLAAFVRVERVYRSGDFATLGIFG